MNKWLVVAMLMAGTSAYACKDGWVASDVPGVCQESDLTNAVKPSDEKPPEDKMPSWQRPGVVVVDAVEDTQKREQDEDQLKANVNREIAGMKKSRKAGHK